MSVYPINTSTQFIYVAHNSEDANAYTTALTTGGFNFSVQYENYFEANKGKVETWVIVRHKS